MNTAEEMIDQHVSSSTMLVCEMTEVLPHICGAGKPFSIITLIYLSQVHVPSTWQPYSQVMSNVVKQYPHCILEHSGNSQPVSVNVEPLVIIMRHFD